MQRRRFLAGAGSLIATAAPASRVLAEAAHPSADCFTTRSVTPGPFVLPESPLRSDIREGLAGIPLRLRIQVLDDVWCQPAAGVHVDIWQCDAAGRYSGAINMNFDPDSLRIAGEGLDLRGEQFLRGRQVTGEDGRVEFMTVFPGWYMPRLPHIHMRAIWGDVPWTQSSTQLFFPEDVQRAVFATEHYVARGQSPIDARRDIVIKGESSRLEALTVQMSKDGDGFVADFELSTLALSALTG